MLQDIQFQSAQHVIDEVRNMNVKGGSPFGRAAAWAYRLACTQEEFADVAALRERFDYISGELLSLKPTMATIYNSKSLVYKKLDSFPAGTEISTITGEIAALCQRIIQYSLSAVDHLGENGAQPDPGRLHGHDAQLFERPDERLYRGRQAGETVQPDLHRVPAPA